ncbi:probable cytochrome P450 6a13 [Schistocerca cancellata]|uniref:probable cytochrome P450 6a13 n=1 Tax=Schistocerca cancellata TaxID=274614 RepID=UPI002117E437|nr:probable cytochrome P450 6a13 [Schistocerca cancellata]
MWLWYSLVLLVVAAALLLLYLYSVNQHWMKLGIPHPKPELFFGNTRRFFLLKECLPEALDRVYHQLEGLPFGGFYLMMTPCLVVRDLGLINRIFVGDFGHFHDRMNFPHFKRDPMTHHLFTMGGSLWKEMRLRMSQVFSVGHTRRVFFLVQECCSRLQKSVDATVRRQPGCEVELKQLLSTFTTDVIGVCAFGIECGAIDDVNSQFRRISSMVFDTSTPAAIRQVVAQTLPTVALLPGMSFFSNHVKEFFDRIATETYQYREKHNVLRDDVVHLLMTLRQEGKLTTEEGECIEISDKLMAAHLLMTFALGFEMTSTTMSFCLHELAMNPDVQTKARVEVDAVLSRHGGEMTYEALQEMRYLDMVVAETLRLYPPMAYLMRQCTEPYQVPGSDLRLRVGDVVYVPLLSLHRDPRLFPEPLRFNPERFSGGHAHPAYLPFGDGPRICLGQKFGLVEVKACLVALLSRFEFRRCSRSLDSPVPLEPRKVILAAASGLYVRVTPRAWLPVS